MISDWRLKVLNNFIPCINHKWIVYDYDSLLADEEIITKIVDQGFSIIEFSDAIRFRYEYETICRNKWDDGITDFEVIILVHNPEIDDLKIPYDVAFGARIVSLNLSDIFPQIDITVLRVLNHKDYDLLQDGLNYEKLNNNVLLSVRESVIFVLKSVFDIYLTAIRDDISFTRLLFDIHTRELCLNKIFVIHIIEYFREKSILYGWNVELLLTSADSFWKYIQNVFVYKIQGKVTDKNPGPLDLDVFSYDLLVYLDNAFVDGKLTPLSVDSEVLRKSPRSIIGVGLINKNDDIAMATETRVRELFDKLIGQKISSFSSYSDWFSFANLYFVWLNLKELYGQMNQNEIEFQHRVNYFFEEWLKKRFDSLCFESTSYPIMGIRVLPYLQGVFQNNQKVALIVMDGMSSSDWITIRSCLPSQKYIFNEKYSFSWIPSITSVSRQVLFSGKMPKFFSDKINTTNYEKTEWITAWTNNFSYLNKEHIYYKKGLGGDSMESLWNDCFDPYVMGLVINTVDDLMHGPQVLGMNSFHRNIKMWMENRYLDNLIGHLLQESYAVFITSDHGHLNCIGTGQINEGVLAEDKGQRMRCYSSSTIRDNTLEKYDNLICWNSTTLPGDYNPLIAMYGNAFVPKGRKIITHGGISLEENIIPWIEVKLKNE